MENIATTSGGERWVKRLWLSYFHSAPNNVNVSNQSVDVSQINGKGSVHRSVRIGLVTALISYL